MKPFFLPILSICWLLIINSSNLLAQTTDPSHLTPEQRAAMKRKTVVNAPKQRIVIPNIEYKRTNQKGVEVPSEKQIVWQGMNGTTTAPQANVAATPKNNSSAGLRKAKVAPQPKATNPPTFEEHKAKIVNTINQRLAELKKIKQPTQSDKAEIEKLKQYLLEVKNTK